MLAAGLSPHVALATNKGQASFGAVSSFASFWTKNGIDRARAPLGFGAGFVGALAGARVVLSIRPEPLKPVILVLLLVAAGFVIYPRKPPPSSSAAEARREPRSTERGMVMLVPIAFGLGFYDGFFGPGTGSLLIVSFVIVFNDTLTRASGNAKAVNLASNLAALLLFSLKGAILWHVAAPMAAANAIGAFAGARLAIKGGDRLVRFVVLCVVAILVLTMAHDLVRAP